MTNLEKCVIIKIVKKKHAGTPAHIMKGGSIMNEQKKTTCKELEAIRKELADALNQMRAPDMADIADSFSRIKKNHPENIAEACEELRDILKKYGTRAAEYGVIYKKLNYTDEYQKETRRICKCFREYGERMAAIREQADKYPAAIELFRAACEALAPCFFDDPETLQKLGPWGLRVAAIVVSKETTPDAVKIGIYKDSRKYEEEANKEAEEFGPKAWAAYYDRYCANGCDIFSSLFNGGLIDRDGDIIEAEATEAEAEATEAEATEATEATEEEATETKKEDCPKAKKATACKYDRRAVMVYAWQLCRLAVNAHGGKACEYFAEALKEAWRVAEALKEAWRDAKSGGDLAEPAPLDDTPEDLRPVCCQINIHERGGSRKGRGNPKNRHRVRPIRPPPEPAWDADFRVW